MLHRVLPLQAGEANAVRLRQYCDFGSSRMYPKLQEASFWYVGGIQDRCPMNLSPSFGLANLIPWDQPGTARASTSRSTQSTRRKWNFACSTVLGNVRLFVSRSASKLTWSGTAICRNYVRANCTDTGCMAHTPRSKAIVLITTSSCSTPMASKFREPSGGATPTSDTGSDTGRRTCLLTGAMMPLECPNAKRTNTPSLRLGILH